MLTHQANAEVLSSQVEVRDANLTCQFSMNNSLQGNVDFNQAFILVAFGAGKNHNIEDDSTSLEILPYERSSGKIDFFSEHDEIC